MRYWSLLEERTAVVVNTLQGASESYFDQKQQQPGNLFCAGRFVFVAAAIVGVVVVGVVLCLVVVMVVVVVVVLRFLLF